MTNPSVILVWLGSEHSADDARRLLGDVDLDIVIVDAAPDTDDARRTTLLTSVRDARDLLASRGGDPDELVLVGLGRGAVAAAGLARYAKRLGIRLGQVWCVAPTWDEPDPFSGAPVTEVPEGIELVPDAAQLGPRWITCQRPR